MSTKLFDVTRSAVKITWYWYAGGLVAFVLSTWLSIQLPRLIQTALDYYISHPEDGDQIKVLAWLMLLVGLGIAMIRALSRTLVLLCGRIVESAIRDQYFLRALNFKLKSMEAFKVGELISRLTTDARQVGLFYGLGMVQVIHLILTTGFALSYMMSVHIPLTIYVCMPMVLQVMSARLIIPQLFRLSKAQQVSQARLSEQISESLYHVHALHAEGCIDSFYQQICRHNTALQQANVKLSTFREKTMPYIGLLSQLSYVIVLMYGGMLVAQDQMTVGQVAAFQSYVALLSLPLMGFGLFVAVRERAKAALERFSELDRLAIEPAPVGTQLLQPNAQHDMSQPPLLRLKDVTFCYDYPPDQVLSGLNLEVFPGEHLGISGKIGAGKSTLFKVLMKLYDPQEGQYEFGGQDIRDVSVVQLRAVMGFVTQDSSFFSSTIAQNLTMGLEDSSLTAEELTERMVAVTQTALIYDEIQGFEYGFETQIGEKGVRLSGGQKTRLALARALMHQRDVYLLDDIFSALDHGVEQALIHNLSALKCTFILVSHRQSVLDFCHRRLTLVGGKLHELA